jgi:hypothetical protein
MSQLEVDKVIPQSGTTLTLGESGDTVSVPSGATLDASNATLTLPDDSVTTAKIDDSAVTTAKLADANITTAKLAYDPNPFRNIVINGDMSLAQRSTSVASLTTGGYRTLDRWYFDINSFGTWTMSQSTDTPTGQGFATSLKVDCTTADASPAAGDYLQLIQIFEGQNLQYLKKGTANAVSLTASFWVKSTKTGTFIAEFFDNDNTRSISQSYTVNTTNTWEKKTITIPGDTTGAFGNDNGASFYLIIWLAAGTDFTSGTLATTWGSRVNANTAVGQVNIADDTANDFLITGVQLEAGTTASDFEFLPVDVNLGRCQRYYQSYEEDGDSNSKVPSALTAYGTNNATGGINYFTRMRTDPSVTHNALRANYGGGVTNITAISFYATSYSSGMDITVTGQSWSTGRCITIQHASGSYIRFDAEL